MKLTNEGKTLRAISTGDTTGWLVLVPDGAEEDVVKTLQQAVNDPSWDRTYPSSKVRDLAKENGWTLALLYQTVDVLSKKK